jgi:hypothetical protein
MAITNIRGFIPTRHLQGRTSFQMELRPTGDGTKGKNDTQIYPGDVVYLDASGGIQRFHDAASGGDSQLPLGVVGQVFNADRRPYTFNQPGTGGPYIPTSTMGFAGVYEDPGIIYQAEASATATYLNIGKFLQVRVCAPNTAAGRSGMGVDMGTTATAAGHPFKMYGISPLDGVLDEARISGEVNNQVQVVLVNSQWTNPFFRQVQGAADVSGLTN